ncbi:MAG: NAD-dependent epimerase/dehydratase family protein [Desulfobulbaceae bacterium]|nr:NAD-dependent epimerase/dehydratase family protein [Desulfobulbaceae bacterium]
MKAFVTGGGGFVGSAIVRQLVDKGVEVSVFGRNHYPHLENLGVRQFQGNLLDSKLLIRTMQGHDTVFHVAAKAGIWGQKHEFEQTNVTGTRNVLGACYANGVNSLVYTSTPSVVFYRRDIKGADERLPYAKRFLCYYASSKAIAEQMVIAGNSEILKTCAIRPHLVWGPGDPHLIPRLIARGRAKKLKQVGNGQNMVDISYIDNVADAHILAAENLNSSATASGNAYFISQGEPVNLWNWINKLFERMNIEPVKKKINGGTAYIIGSILEGIYTWFSVEKEPPMTRFLAEQLAKSHWFSIDRARHDFGYEPRISTTEGMDRLIQWLAIKNNTNNLQ